ncbi:MAG TPA: polysaccharide biosynthesis/export family protein [Kofleriaceae bacterium]|nr:polysaccharide biosynthesis/export family protein [Kofleriaceae bacterium]
MKFRAFAFLVVVLSLSVACGDPPPASYPNTGPAGLPASSEAPLGPGDVFELRIYYGSNELKSAHRLNASGKISVQFIGAVDASGRRVAELEGDIQKRLADGYLREPVVSITLMEANSQRITVYGQVEKASTIPYVSGMTIVEAIAQTGGFKAMAKKNAVQVTRVIQGKKRSFTVPVESIGEGKRPNFAMEPGDTVFVPERLF